MTRTSRSTLSFALLTSLFLFSGSQCTIKAQATAVAQVSGTVTDATGAAIVNAQVTMTETSKNLVRTVATDVGGRYALPNLPVGPYRLEVTSQGFKNYVQDGIVLVVNNNIEINVPMQIGAASERVEVSALASMVETKETSVSSVIDQKRIAELPLNGRQATQLIITLGGAAYGDAGDTGSKTFYSSTRISVAGGQSNGTAYLLDGGENTDAMSNVNLPFPFPDALQEFSIETSAVSSRFGTHPGATVNVVTKSGANDFHGDLFEYLRNGNVNARNFFSTGRDTLKRNQFGGTLGGRILRDKLFFFVGYQGTRNRSNPPLMQSIKGKLVGEVIETAYEAHIKYEHELVTDAFKRLVLLREQVKGGTLPKDDQRVREMARLEEEIRVFRKDSDESMDELMAFMNRNRLFPPPAPGPN